MMRKTIRSYRVALWTLGLAAIAACSTSTSTGADSAVDATKPTDGAGLIDAITADVASADASTAVQLLSTYPLQAEFPEGGAYDVAGKAFYIGSLGDGTVHRVGGTTGAESVYFQETATGHWWTLGMDVDPTFNRLWVCAMDDRSPQPRAGFIWVFDLATGERTANIALSDAAADATCTDVVVAKDGAAFVVDREAPNIYRIDLDGNDATGTAKLFASDPMLKGTIAGQNAVVLLPDESALLTVVYTPPALIRVDLATQAVTKVTLHGPFKDDAPLSGADGMDYRDGSVYVAFSSKLVRAIPRGADWTEADTTSTDIAAGMTGVINTPDGLFLLNGQSIRFALKQEADPFQLVRYLGLL